MQKCRTQFLAVLILLMVTTIALSAPMQYGHFATSLAELVHSGSFTKRMVNPTRGDYTASFTGKKDSFVLTMTPAHLDAQHRSFYAEDDGKIHAEEEKLADASSPVVK